MDNGKNFLDLLSQRVEELQEKGIINEEELVNGIEICQEWLYSSSIERAYIVSAMSEYLIKNSKTYLENCNGLGKKPEELSKIILKKTKKELEIDAVGSDEWTKLIITNKKDEDIPFLQITPDEFAEQVYERTMARKQWDATQRAGKDVDLFQVRKIFDEIMDDKTIKSIKDGQKIGLEEMVENLVSYYEYLLNEEKANDTIYAGYRNRDKDIGRLRGPSIKPEVEKVNPNISFADRKQLLESLSPQKKIIYANPSNEQGNEPQISDFICLYESPDGDGYLMICEPFNGNESTRLVNISKEKINEFLLPEHEIDEDFWKNLTRRYIDMSDNEFIKEPNTSTIYHRDPQNYLDSIKQIVTKYTTKEEQKDLPHAIKIRLQRVWGRLFKGNKEPDVKKTVLVAVENGEITQEDLDAVGHFFDDPTKNIDTKDKQGEEL